MDPHFLASTEHILWTFTCTEPGPGGPSSVAPGLTVASSALRAVRLKQTTTLIRIVGGRRAPRRRRRRISSRRPAGSNLPSTATVWNRGARETVFGRFGIDFDAAALGADPCILIIVSGGTFNLRYSDLETYPLLKVMPYPYEPSTFGLFSQNVILWD
uniref:Uncharacterized protein n=1 Tax=Steinernema glaseri TaxID=37863 RepID=A0A1I8AKA2_9BILA